MPRLPYAFRLGLALTVTVSLFCFIGVVFWYQDWRYSMPTPRPSGLVQPPAGSTLVLPAALAEHSPEAQGRPLVLHFFSTSCPCSKFNLDHVRDLIRRYRDRVTFVAVLESRNPESALRSYAGLGLGIPATVDTAENLAARFGVYSTPQVVILDHRGRLYYRGNYNTSRYCTNPATEFARLSIEGLLARHPAPLFIASATTAYGCELPRRAASRPGLPGALDRLARESAFE
ncbi:MAG: thioredoxin fold domain-containing protein [Bryobacteraceae bacterium]